MFIGLWKLGPDRYAVLSGDKLGDLDFGLALEGDYNFGETSVLPVLFLLDGDGI